jgi:peptide/nickel transport system permease protein
MYRYILKRTLFMVLSVFIACMMTFMLMNVIPGGTPEIILKHTFVGQEESVSDEELATISERYNLNDPLYLQFFRWMQTGLLHGTWEPLMFTIDQYCIYLSYDFRQLSFSP